MKVIPIANINQTKEIEKLMSQCLLSILTEYTIKISWSSHINLSIFCHLKLFLPKEFIKKGILMFYTEIYLAGGRVGMCVSGGLNCMYNLKIINTYTFLKEKSLSNI